MTKGMLSNLRVVRAKRCSQVVISELRRASRQSDISPRITTKWIGIDAWDLAQVVN
jgi:hypothetical protein